MSVTIENIKANERVYKSLKNITYIFQEGSNKHKLIVIFSANNAPGQFHYNYISTLEHLPYNKLFILDNFGKQGAYYLGEKLDFSIETSVVSLINYYINKFELYNKDIITIGSSKGGYAALYYGIKYFFGNIIVGGPQTYLGNFLYNEGKVDNIIEYLVPQSMEEPKKYLNDIFYNIINENNILVPNIYIHIGSGDHHYKNHIIPFLDYIEKYNKKNISLDVVDYIGHDGLRKHFPGYMSKNLSKILNYDLYKFNPIKIIDIKLNSYKKIEVGVEVAGELNSYEFAYYLYKENNIIEKQFYTSKNICTFDLKGKGDYKTKVFVKNKDRKHCQMSEIISVDEISVS